MADLTSVTTSLAMKAAGTEPPKQWIWAACLALVAIVASILLNKEMANAAKARADLELEKKHAEDLRTKARAEENSQQVILLLETAAKIESRVRAQEQVLADQLAALDLKADAIRRARKWEDLENA